MGSCALVPGLLDSDPDPGRIQKVEPTTLDPKTPTGVEYRTPMCMYFSGSANWSGK